MTDLVKSLKIGNNSYGIKDDKAVPAITKDEEATLSFTGLYRDTPVTETNTYLTKEGVVVEKGKPAWTNNPIVKRHYCGIAANDDICVVSVYSSRVFMYSTDKGKTWKDTQVPVSGSYDVICYGNGKFVALYGSVGLYSTDGINWTRVSLPIAQTWSSVCYGAGKYVAVSNNSSDFLYSTDGITWTNSTLPSDMSWGNCIVYGGGKFVIIGWNLGKAAYSTDGINWTVTDLPSSAYWRSLAFFNGKFVTSVFNPNLSNAVLAQSDDGVTWTSLQLDLNGSCTVASSSAGFVFVDSSKTLFSSDLVSYTEVDGQAAVVVLPKFASSSDALFLRYGDYSTDISVLPIDVVSRSAVTTSLITAIAYGNGKFVAVPMNDDKGAYSTDGLVWNEMTMPSSNRWTTCVYGNGTFVSTLDLDNSDVAAYSTDGITWQATTLPATGYWNLLMFADNKFVAVSSATTDVAYSTDGITWQASTHPAIGSVYDTAYGNGVFVLLSLNSVAYSSDAATWQSTSLPSGHRWYYVTYGGGKFVAIDYNVQTGSTSAVYSTNGSTWHSSTLPAVAAWEKPVYSNGRFVVTGHTMSSPVVRVCAYSTDGITWSLAQLPITTVGQITVKDGLFVALANNQNSTTDITLGAYSTDGATWIPFEVPSYSQFTAIASGADKFVAAARKRGSGMNFTYYLLALKIGFLPYSKELSYTAAEVDAALASKQGTLTAGTGISISNNTISTDALRNTATTSYSSLTIGGTAATGISSINIGLSSSASGDNCLAVGRGSSTYSAHDCVALGASSSTQDDGGIAIGTSANTQSKDEVAIGAKASAAEFGSIAIGAFTKTTGVLSVAVGYNAEVTAASAVQLGAGTNATESSLQFRSYPLVDSSGNIPAARLSNIYEIVQTLPASPTAGKIYFVTGS